MQDLLRRVWCFMFLFALFSTVTAAEESNRRTAELLLLNGHIYTSNPARPWAQALAIRAGRILAVGDDAEVLKFKGPGTRVLDLGGRTAMPGIIDSHIHFLDGSLSLD